MAHVTLAAPITGLSGKLSKSHACVFNMRQAPTNNERMISMPCYTNWRENKHTKRASTTWNTQFAQIAADTRARLKNPTYVDDDVVAFKAQSKFKTLHAFVFNIVKEGVLNGK